MRVAFERGLLRAEPLPPILVPIGGNAPLVALEAPPTKLFGLSLSLGVDLGHSMRW